MKAVIWLVILAGIAWGGKWLYDNGYVDEARRKFDKSSFSESLNNTVQRTADFATDKAVKEADY
ncbi:MAG: hypothetical protein IJ184_02535 [Alphaproteobacteria bacterium]|nr:hypothetical protein [Alphaproteobacteria bacterium]